MPSSRKVTNQKRNQSNHQEALDYLELKDKKLASVIKLVGPFVLEVDHMQSPYHALAESIVYQQLTGKAAATIFKRFCLLFNSEDCPSPQAVLKSSPELLRSAGLSQNKASALMDLSQKAVDGFIPSLEELEKMNDDEIIEQLSQIRGIGKWTVQMMLIFRLARLDVMPSNDYGIRKGFAKVYGKNKFKDDLPSPKHIEEHAKCWQPYRSIASWYLWRSLDLP